eukprot:3645000-Pyramimonas_sp.AAC.1
MFLVSIACSFFRRSNKAQQVLKSAPRLPWRPPTRPEDALDSPKTAQVAPPRAPESPRRPREGFQRGPRGKN